MTLTLDGGILEDSTAVHSVLSESLDFGPYYGGNLSALWDRLTVDVERPLSIRWTHAAISRKRMGDDFLAFEKLFKDLEKYDRDLGLEERFRFEVRD